MLCMAYSLDLRQKIVDAYTNSSLGYLRISKIFGVGICSVRRFIAKDKAGDLKAKHPPGRPANIENEELIFLKEILAKKNDLTILEICGVFKEKKNKIVTSRMLETALCKINFTRKKKAFIATERQTDRVKKLREIFKLEQDKLEFGKIVWLDEAGTNIGMAKEYGWSKKGDRAEGHRPGKFCRNYTMIGAINESGISTLMTTLGGTTGEVFLHFVKNYLGPTLRPNDVVIMDNLSSHKVDGVKEAIEKTGAFVKYLPPYSPDLNPIENCWSKMKERLKKISARTYEKLDEAIVTAMDSVTQADIKGWAKNCGYSL